MALPAADKDRFPLSKPLPMPPGALRGGWSRVWQAVMETFCEEPERSWDLREEGLVWQRGSRELEGRFSPQKLFP